MSPTTNYSVMKLKPEFLTNHCHYVVEGFPWDPMQSANLSWVPLLCSRHCCRDWRWASRQIIAVLGAGGYSLGYVWNVLGVGREHWLVLSQEGWGWFHQMVHAWPMRDAWPKSPSSSITEISSTTCKSSQNAFFKGQYEVICYAPTVFKREKERRKLWLNCIKYVRRTKIQCGNIVIIYSKRLVGSN